MMAGDIAPLGFSVDTKPLEAAKQAAQQAEVQIGKLGQAVDNLANKGKATNQWATGLQGQMAALNVQWGQFSTKAKEADKAVTDHGSKLNALGGIINTTRMHVSALASQIGAGGGGVAGGGALTTAIGSANAGLTSMLTMLPRIGPVAGAAAAAIAALAVAAAGLIVVTAGSQDKMAAFDARLRNTLGSAAAATQAFQKLQESAKATGISFDSTADAFLRIARNSEAIGASNAQILQLTETIQKLGIISGASQGEVASGMIQLSQALASGRLNGDELRSIMENMPALAKAIADGLKVSVGELRRMGAEGQLTSEKVFGALISQTQKVDAEFKKMPDTVERAFTRMSNSASQLTANIGKSINASQTLQAIFRWIERNIDVANKAFSGDATDDAVERQSNLVRALKEQIETVKKGLDFDGRKKHELEVLNKALKEQTDLYNRLAKAQADAHGDALTAAFKEAGNQARAFIALGEQTAKELDKVGQETKELQANIDKLTNATKALKPAIESGVATPEQLEQWIKFNNLLEAQRRLLLDNVDALTKMRRETDAMTAVAARGGTQADFGINREVQTFRTQLDKAGFGGSVTDDEIRTSIINKRVAATKLENNELARQIEIEKELDKAAGKGMQAKLMAQARVQALTAAFKEYGVALFESAELMQLVDEKADLLFKKSWADYTRGLADQTAELIKQGAVIDAQIKAITQGAYAMREAAARVRASQEGGGGQAALDLFSKQESLAVLEQLQAIEKQVALEKALAAAAGDVKEQKRLQLEFDIKAAQENVHASYREDIRAAKMEENLAREQRAMAESNAKIREQIDLTKEEAQLAGLSGEEYAVQNALLQKKYELIRQGVDLQSEEAKTAMALTSELAKATYQVQRQKDAAAETQRIWTKALEGIQQSFADFFTQVFSGGVKTWRSLADSMKAIWFRMLGEIAAASIIRPVLSPIVQLGGALGIVPGGVAAQYGGASGGAGIGGGIFGGMPNLNLFGSGGAFSGVGNFFNTRLLGGAEMLGPALPGQTMGFTGGLTVGGALAGLGSIGMGIYGLTQGNTVGGLAGILGGGLGMLGAAVPALGFLGPIGLGVGLLGGLLGSLFGKKRKTPQAVTNLLFDAAGRPYSELAMSRGGGNVSGTGKSVDALSGAIGDITTAYDLRFLPGATGGYILNSQGKNTGDQWIAGLGRYGGAGGVGFGAQELAAGLTAEQAIDMVAGAIFKKAAQQGKLGGAGLTATAQRALGFADLQSIDDIKKALDFSKTYDDLVRGPAGITSMEKAVRDLNTQFRAAITQAKEYGLATGVLEQRQREAIAQLGKDMDANVRRQLLSLTPEGQLLLSKEDIAKQRQTALSEAAYLGTQGVNVDTGRINQLYDAMLKAVLDANRQQATDFNASTRLSLLQLTDPAAAQRESLKIAQDARWKQAQEIAKTNPGLVDFAKLIALNNAELKELEKTLTATNDGIRAALDRLKFGGASSQFTIAQQQQMALREYQSLEAAAISGKPYDQGRLTSVADQLLDLTRQRYSIGSGYTDLATRIQRLYEWIINPTTPKPQGFAKGGRGGPGWIIAGEQGPELIRLPASASIYSAAATAMGGDGAADLLRALLMEYRRLVEMVDLLNRQVAALTAVTAEGVKASRLTVDHMRNLSGETTRTGLRDQARGMANDKAA